MHSGNNKITEAARMWGSTQSPEGVLLSTKANAVGHSNSKHCLLHFFRSGLWVWLKHLVVAQSLQPRYPLGLAVRLASGGPGTPPPPRLRRCLSVFTTWHLASLG